MKKLFSVVLFLLVIHLSVFSEVTNMSGIGKSDRGTRSINLLAQKGDYNYLSVSGLQSTSLASGTGMPFYLTSENVQNSGDVNNGRQIAEWTLATNYTPVVLTIKADPLVAVTPEANKKSEINYILGFYYYYPVVENGNPTGEISSGTIEVHSNSETEYNSENDEECSFKDVLAGGAIAFSGLPVRFMLESGEEIDSESYSKGYYSAEVRVTLAGE